MMLARGDRESREGRAPVSCVTRTGVRHAELWRRASSGSSWAARHASVGAWTIAVDGALGPARAIPQAHVVAWTVCRKATRGTESATRKCLRKLPIHEVRAVRADARDASLRRRAVLRNQTFVATAPVRCTALLPRAFTMTRARLLCPANGTLVALDTGGIARAVTRLLAWGATLLERANEPCRAVAREEACRWRSLVVRCAA